MEMLNAGLTDILVVDDYKAVLWSSVFPNLKLHHDIPINTGGEFGWMFRKDSPRLKAAINEFASTHKQGTLLGNIFVSRYVDKSRFVRNALSSGETDRFRKVVDLFRHYGDQYDLDYMLLLAQSYQESGLNQQAKSPVGAIGIMQLMPATGNQMNVGDIRQLETNIHAGVKYIRHLVDHYYSDEPMDELNKILFAFASYNAGRAASRVCVRQQRRPVLIPICGSITLKCWPQERSERKPSPMCPIFLNTMWHTNWYRRRNRGEKK